MLSRLPWASGFDVAAEGTSDVQVESETHHGVLTFLLTARRFA
jgi:hypothetical protein